jgi:hypothetical protein
MLTPRRRLFTSPSSPSHTPLSQAPTLRNATSSTAIAQPGFGLRLKRSLTFLRTASRVSVPPRPETQIGHHDEAVRLARTQFLNDVQERRVEKKPSRLLLPKMRPPHKAFRRSVRSSQTRETDESMNSDTPSYEVPMPIQTKRSFSSSIRDRVMKAFGRSVSNKSSLPPQQLEATRQHFTDIDDIGGTSSFDNYQVDTDEDRRESFYVPSRPEQHNEEERDRFSPTLDTAGSRESLHSNARSRVTSWTNSSMTSSTIRGPALERNRLSIIKEDGGPHEPSCSAGRHIGGISVFQDPLEAENEEGHLYPPVDSHRIYSALMKRIGEEEVEIERTKAALDEIHEGRFGDDHFSGGNPTIRAVSATSIGTEATGRNTDMATKDSSPSEEHFQKMTPTIHQENVERRKVKLMSQEEQSSFFPFSDQGGAPTPSPFRKFLEQRRSEDHSKDAEQNFVQADPGMSKKRNARKLTGGRFGLSSDSVYSQTTNGGENPSYIPPIGSSDELLPVTQKVDEDTGMATIIPARYRPVERPKLHSADSSERREWKGWAEGELDASLGRRDYSKAGIHYREHAQIDPDDLHFSRGETGRPRSRAGTANRFPLLDLKEVPRNNTPAPKRSLSLTKSQSGLLNRASMAGMKNLSDRNDENKKFGSAIRKFSPGNLANMLKEKKSQILMSRADDSDKENKLSTTNGSPRSSSPPMSTPGRLGLQMRSGNGRLRKQASDMAVRTGQKHDITPKNVSTPLQPKTEEYDESPTDRVKQSLSARLSRPFNMDVPEPNRPFDSMFLGKQDLSLGSERLSTAVNAGPRRPKGYGGLGPNPFDGDREDTALPQIRTSNGGNALANDPRASEKGRAGWSSTRMVSDFLKKRRQARSASTEENEGRASKEGQSPAFV